MTTEYQVGEFKVKVREASLGPLVWGHAKRDANGQRHLLDLPLEPEALPAPATGRQVAILNVSIQHSVLSEHVLPEMSRRVGRSVDLDTFYASPHWQKWLQKAQVLFHGGRGYDVRLNDEVVLPPPPDGHVTLIRERGTWSGQPVRLIGDWLPTFERAVRDQSRRQMQIVAREILAGKEATSKKLVDSWFPLERELNVDPIYEELPKEIYALLSRKRNQDPLDVLFDGFRHARETLKCDYDWSRLTGAGLYEPGVEALRFDDAKAETDMLCDRAGLTERQRRIVGLECALAAHGERWLDADKAQYLGLLTGNYEEGLSTARAALKRAYGTSEPPEAAGFRRLVNAIAGKGLTSR